MVVCFACVYLKMTIKNCGNIFKALKIKPELLLITPIFRSKLLAKIVFANISNILYEKLKKLAHTAEYIRFELNISVFCMI